MRIIAPLLASLTLLIGPAGAALAAVTCPPMPAAVTSINKDVKSDITATIGALGKLKAGEIGIKTEVVSKNLFDKYPNVDKLLTLQTMAATYCEMLNASKLSDSDRLDRWEKFQEKVLDLQSKSQAAPVKKEKTSAPAKPAINAKSYPLLAGMRIGVMYVERENKYMAEIKDRLTRVGANVTANEVSDWKGYPEYVGRLLYHPENLESATQLKALVADFLVTRLYETQEIFNKYDLIIWLDPAK